MYTYQRDPKSAPIDVPTLDTDFKIGGLSIAIQIQWIQSYIEIAKLDCVPFIDADESDPGLANYCFYFLEDHTVISFQVDVDTLPGKIINSSALRYILSRILFAKAFPHLKSGKPGSALDFSEYKPEERPTVTHRKAISITRIQQNRTQQ